jgi:hypothetical protein
MRGMKIAATHAATQAPANSCETNVVCHELRPTSLFKENVRGGEAAIAIAGVLHWGSLPSPRANEKGADRLAGVLGAGRAWFLPALLFVIGAGIVTFLLDELGKAMPFSRTRPAYLGDAETWLSFRLGDARIRGEAEARFFRCCGDVLMPALTEQAAPRIDRGQADTCPMTPSGRYPRFAGKKKSMCFKSRRLCIRYSDRPAVPNSQPLKHGD